MSDAAWSFWGAVIGGIVSGAIAWFISTQQVRYQILEQRKRDEKQRTDDLVLRLLREMNEYVHYSFRKGDEAKNFRQKAARELLTTALIVCNDKVIEFDAEIRSVYNFHLSKEYKTNNFSTSNINRTNFTKTKELFDRIQNELTQKHFGVMSSVLADEN